MTTQRIYQNVLNELHEKEENFLRIVGQILARIKVILTDKHSFAEEVDQKILDRNFNLVYSIHEYLTTDEEIATAGYIYWEEFLKEFYFDSMDSNGQPQQSPSKVIDYITGWNRSFWLKENAKRELLTLLKLWEGLNSIVEEMDSSMYSVRESDMMLPVFRTHKDVAA